MADESTSRHGDEEPSLVHAIRHARTGDSAALGALIESCRGYLLAIAQGEIDDNLRVKVGSSDLVQETCIKAHAKFDDFRGETREELLGWMRKILLNNLTDCRRRYHGAQKRELDREEAIVGGSVAGVSASKIEDDDLTPGAAALFHEQVDALRAALLQLSEEDRQVIILRTWRRLPFSDVGAKMNRSSDAARKLWSRAVLRLAEAMPENSEDG